MPQRIQVTVEKDHLQTLTRTRPISGVAELIWNGLDAEANNLRVKVVQETVLGTVESVEVEDDGHGMTHSEAVAAFEHLGGSWKLGQLHSRNHGRLLHGHFGQGRWRAFAVGNFIQWITI